MFPSDRVTNLAVLTLPSRKRLDSNQQPPPETGGALPLSYATSAPSERQERRSLSGASRGSDAGP